MKPINVLPFVLLTITGAAVFQATRTQAVRAAEANHEVGEYVLLEPIRVGHVSFVPVAFRNAPSESHFGKYLTLGEAQKLKLVKIEEVPGNEQVNSLKVENLAKLPLMLFAGELLSGGKQDRIVAKDTIVKPIATQEVAVYCVEHGRWQGDTAHFSYESKMVPNRVRKAAVYGGQGEVWDNVDTFNSGAGKSKGSLSVREGLSSKEIDGWVTEYLPEILDALDQHRNLAGVMFVMNGRIQNMDLFGSPALFRSARRGLLHGILSDAALVTPTSKEVPTLAECAAWLEGVMKSREESMVVQSDGVSAKMKIQSGAYDTRAAEFSSAPLDRSSKKLGKMSDMAHGTYSVDVR